MKKILSTLSLFPLLLQSQERITEYVTKNASLYTKENFSVNLGDEFYENNVVFWGYIHGSATPQHVEYALLEDLVNKGFTHYMPEIGFAQAYFFNQYLQTGNEDYLNFSSYYQNMRTPQDASVEFLDKWKKIYLLNQDLPEEGKLTVLGEDVTIFPYDPTLAITYLAYVAPPSDIPMIDSLKYFKNLDILDINIISGKPAWELAQVSGKVTYDYVYPMNSKYQFARRFHAYYLENKEEIINGFGSYGKDVKRLLESSGKKREATIYDNFNREVMPLIENGAKVFSAYGYAHIMQASINKYDYLAGLIKKSQPEIQVTSILGLLAKSSALKNRKLKKTGTLEGLENLLFKSATYDGYTTSKSYDGDGIFERLNGIQVLKKTTGDHDLLSLSLIESKSPFSQGLTFVDYTKGGKYWRPDPTLSTIDYFQYIIYMQHSEANTPLEEQISFK